MAGSRLIAVQIVAACADMSISSSTVPPPPDIPYPSIFTACLYRHSYLQCLRLPILAIKPLESVLLPAGRSRRRPQ